jgi:hypothetical protein
MTPEKKMTHQEIAAIQYMPSMDCRQKWAGQLAAWDARFGLHVYTGSFGKETKPPTRGGNRVEIFTVRAR